MINSNGNDDDGGGGGKFGTQVKCAPDHYLSLNAHFF